MGRIYCHFELRKTKLQAGAARIHNAEPQRGERGIERTQDEENENSTKKMAKRFEQALHQRRYKDGR